MPEHGCYEGTYRVGSRDSDCHGRCQPSALLSFLQEAGLEALDRAELGRAFLLERHGAVWMLVRVRFELETPVLLGDALEIRVWLREAHGLGVYRDYEIRRNGVAVGRALALWMLARRDTRGMYPCANVAELAALSAPPPWKGERLRRLELPEALTPAGRRTVRYSQADMNGHLNNSRYADLLCDALEPEALAGAYISGLEIGYLAECLPGLVLQLETGGAGAERFFRGVGQDDVPRFEARMRLKDL